MNKRLLDELLDLPPAERLELIGDLWDSLEPSDLPPLTEEQIKELDRRLADHEAHPEKAIPWPEVRARLRARFG